MSTLPGRRYGELDYLSRGASTLQEQEIRGGAYTPDLVGLGATSYEEDRVARCQQHNPATSDVTKPALDTAAMPDLCGMTDVVKVVVGEAGEHVWMLHKDLLIGASDKALETFGSVVEEEQESSFKLPNADPTTFGLFVRYLYTNTVSELEVGPSLELYVLADQLEANLLKKQLQNSLGRKLQLFSGGFTEANLKYVLEHTREGDQIRRNCLYRISFLMCGFAISDFSTDFKRFLHQKYAQEMLAMIAGLYDQTYMASAEADELSAKRRKLLQTISHKGAVQNIQEKGIHAMATTNTRTNGAMNADDDSYSTAKATTNKEVEPGPSEIATHNPSNVNDPAVTSATKTVPSIFSGSSSFAFTNQTSEFSKQSHSASPFQTFNPSGTSVFGSTANPAEYAPVSEAATFAQAQARPRNDSVSSVENGSKSPKIPSSPQ